MDQQQLHDAADSGGMAPLCSSARDASSDSGSRAGSNSGSGSGSGIASNGESGSSEGSSDDEEVDEEEDDEEEDFEAADMTPRGVYVKRCLCALPGCMCCVGRSL